MDGMRPDSLRKVYLGPVASGRDAGPSSKGARRNASRHGGQMPCVVTGRTAADSGPGSGPGRTTPHQAHTRIQAGEDSALGPIAFPSKIKGSIGCPWNCTRWGRMDVSSSLFLLGKGTQ